GSLFPWVVSRFSGAAGSLYGVSSLGSILGAFLGGPVGAAFVSLEDSYRLGISLPVFLTCLGTALVPSPTRRGVWRFPASFLLALLLLFPLLGGTGPVGNAWDPRRLLSGVYQWSRADLESLALEESLRSREILSLARGQEVIVSVELDRVANTVYVRGNGKV